MADQLLTTKQAITLCVEKGREISRSVLYWVARKYGFLETDKRPFLFNKEKMLTLWLNKSVQEIPEGWLTILEAAKKNKTTVHNIYFWIKKGKLLARCYGTGKGVTYVENTSVQAIMQNRYNRNKKTHMEKT